MEKSWKNAINKSYLKIDNNMFNGKQRTKLMKWISRISTKQTIASLVVSTLNYKIALHITGFMNDTFNKFHKHDALKDTNQIQIQLYCVLISKCVMVALVCKKNATALTSQYVELYSGNSTLKLVEKSANNKANPFISSLRLSQKILNSSVFGIFFIDFS